MSQHPAKVADQLSRFIQLEQKLREADSVAALAFVLVNDTHSLLNYQKALFWNVEKGQLTHCSGISQLNTSSPFSVWTSRLCRELSSTDNATTIRTLRATEVSSELAQSWSQWMPPQLLWIPLISPDKELHGALLIASETPMQLAEQPLLIPLRSTASHALTALGKVRQQHTQLKRGLRRWWLPIAAVVLIGLALIPVQQTVLAPAQIEARHPSLLRAPVKGVVASLLVQPNAAVKQGQTLIQLDTRELDAKLDASRQQLAIAQAEFRQAQQQALYDPSRKAQLKVLKSRRHQAQSEVDYLQATRARMTIVAPQDGIAVFDDPSDWIGRPVELGERIMEIANANDLRLAVNLPVADAVALPSQAPVRLFLNTAPTHPIAAHLTRQAYRAKTMFDGSLAYPLKAAFEQTDPALALGLKGTAKLYGERTVLALYLLRRPLATLRVWLSF